MKRSKNGRTRNIRLNLFLTSEEKQLIMDLANKLEMSMTDVLVNLVRKESEK